MGKYQIMVLAGFLLWIGENIYFGWHKTAQSPQEQVLDIVSSVLVLWGIIGDITSNLKITKETNIKTENMEFINKGEVKFK